MVYIDDEALLLWLVERWVGTKWKELNEESKEMARKLPVYVDFVKVQMKLFEHMAAY